jgi:hypothetical protein
MTEYNGLNSVHNVMNKLDPNSDDYQEALEVLADPSSQAAKNFCCKHRIAPLTPKPGFNDEISVGF